MNLLVIDNSEKRAAIRSRRELSKWFPQLGPGTYAGRLSAEGLQDLLVALKQLATRHSAIAIHRVASRDTLELVTIVGSKKSFDSEGRYAFRTRHRPVPKLQPPLQRFFQELTRLAGLAHDFGKANKQFQAMLRGESSAQRVRHDVLGALIFSAAVQGALKRQSGTTSDLTWLQLAKDPRTLFSGVVKDGRFDVASPDALHQMELDIALANKFSGDAAAKSVGSVLSSPKATYAFPAFKAMIWLILTHHRLISRGGGEHSPSSIGSPSFSNFFNPGIAYEAFNLDSTALPWDDDRWSKSWVSCVSVLAELLTSHPSLLQPLQGEGALAFYAHLAYCMRPALILGDQVGSVQQADVYAMASSRKAPGTVPLALGESYANTSRFGAGDSLVTHLRTVSRKAQFVHGVLCKPLSQFPCWDARFIGPSSLLSLNPSPGSKFYWQKEAADAVEGVPAVVDRPFFAALLSAPGSGKTAAGPRILSAASGGQLRFSLGLGLKSLTLQSGSAYRDKLQVPESALAVVIGDQVAAQIHRSAQRTNPSNESDVVQRGSESISRAADDDFEVLRGETPPGPWLQSIQPMEKTTTTADGAYVGVFSPKLIRLIDAPVLVCTVDHLAHAGELTRNEDAKVMLRIASSDLILDEIDNYSAQDLVALGKLIFLHGLYGRRVVLMSGTMSDYLATQLYTAWLRGLRVYQALNGSSAKPLALLVSNVTSPRLLNNADEHTFKAEAASFCRDFSGKLLSSSSKVWPAVGAFDSTSPWEQVTQHCLKLHHAHHVTDPLTGRPFSVGFVRMNSVKGAQALAEHLYNREPTAGEPEVKVTCYHARYPLVIRALIEQALDKGLNRSVHSVPALPEVRDALAVAGPQGLTWIICTTSIEETGRDHDFDWAIVEPSSERSAVQAAGRVLRHRDSLPASPNFLVLSQTRRSVAGEPMPLGRAGIQDNPKFADSQAWLVDHPKTGSALARELQAAGVRFIPSSSCTPVLSALELLPFAAWGSALTPGGCLTTPQSFEDSRLSSLAYLELRDFFESNPDPRQTLKGFFDAESLVSAGKDSLALWLDSRHAQMFRFRKSSNAPEMELTLSRDFHSFKHLVDESTALPISHQAASVKYPSREMLEVAAHLELKAEALLESLGKSLSFLFVLGRGRCVEPSAEILGSSGPKFRYSHLLGFSPVRKR